MMLTRLGVVVGLFWAGFMSLGLLGASPGETQVVMLAMVVGFAVCVVVGWLLQWVLTGR